MESKLKFVIGGAILCLVVVDILAPAPANAQQALTELLFPPAKMFRLYQQSIQKSSAPLSPCAGYCD